jgi:hypothetical protein
MQGFPAVQQLMLMPSKLPLEVQRHWRPVLALVLHSPLLIPARGDYHLLELAV